MQFLASYIIICELGMCSSTAAGLIRRGCFRVLSILQITVYNRNPSRGLKMSSSDPLSFFAGEASSSSESDSEEEDDSAIRESEAKGSSEGPQDSEKLPSPSTLFATVGRPAFLNNPMEKHIDWDRFVKNPEPELEEPNVHSTGTAGSYAAIPPPSMAETVTTSAGSVILSTGGELSAPPVRYSAAEAVDSKQQTVSDKLATDHEDPVTGSKRPHPPVDAPEGSGSKKLKTDHFRQKEKRKRDLGQSSRGKSYVEEEKRILRQQYNTDEVAS